MKWFKHDVSARDSDKIFELTEAHGMQGYGLWWVVVEECYKAEESGFQVKATETWFKRLSRSLNLADWRALLRTLDTMAEVGLICPQHWAEHIVLIPGILERADKFMKSRENNAKRQRKHREKLKQSRVTDALCNGENVEVTHADIDLDLYPDKDLSLSKDPLSKERERGKHFEPQQATQQPLSRGGQNSTPTPAPKMAFSATANFESDFQARSQIGQLSPDDLKLICSYLKATTTQMRFAPSTLKLHLRKNPDLIDMYLEEAREWQRKPRVLRSLREQLASEYGCSPLALNDAQTRFSGDFKNLGLNFEERCAKWLEKYSDYPDAEEVLDYALEYNYISRPGTWAPKRYRHLYQAQEAS